MPRKPQAKKRKSTTEKTPRVRPLEALLRKEGQQAYNEVRDQIIQEGPEMHPEGSTIQHSRRNGMGELVDEKFRITPETITAVLDHLHHTSNGNSLSIIPPIIEKENRPAGIPASILQKTPEGQKAQPEPRSAAPRSPSGPLDQEAEQQAELMREIRSRAIAIGVLMSMPELPGGERIQAESVALQIERMMAVIRSAPRRPARENPELPSLERRLDEMASRTGQVMGAETLTAAEALEYLLTVPDWVNNIQQDLSEHTVTLESGTRIRVSIQGGMDGEISCTSMQTCPWPKCLDHDPRKCSQTGRSWRECGLPDETETQTRTKFLVAKHEDLFPWPPEWEQELEQSRPA